MNKILTEPPKGIGAVIQVIRLNEERDIFVIYRDSLYPVRVTFINKEGFQYRWDYLKNFNPILLHAGYIPPAPPVLEPKVYGVVRGVCGNSIVKRIGVFVRVRPALASWSCVGCPCGYLYHLWAYIDNPEVLFEGVDK